MKYLRPISVLIALVLTFPAHAQGAAARLQEILSRVPVAALTGGDGAIVAGFGNGDAVRWVAVRGAQAGLNPNTPNRFAALRSAPPSQQAVIAAVPDTDLRAAVGLNPGDWVRTFEVGQGNVRLGGMDIFPDSEMRLRGALYSRGFTEDSRDGAPVLWTGTADYTADPARVDPANPFGGDLGLPVRFAFRDSRANWATGWPALDLMTNPAGPTVAGRGDAQALIEGLRRVGNLGTLVSVRAWLRNGGDVPVAGAEAGPVEGLALADYADRETEGAAMVLLLREDVDVDALATGLAEAWPILSDLPSPTTPEFSVGPRTITVTMRSDWGDDGAATNGAYQVFLSVLNGGRLGFMVSR